VNGLLGVFAFEETHIGWFGLEMKERKVGRRVRRGKKRMKKDGKRRN